MTLVYPKTHILFVFVSVIVPVLIYFLLPKFLTILTGKKAVSRLLLAIAGLLFFVAWYLPSPYIQGQFTAFNTHFIGGGIFSGLVWLYIKKQLKLNFSPFFDLLAVYALVSALGVANELFELLVTQLGTVRITPLDTWWDLLANTSGAVLVWIIHTLKKAAGRSR